MEKVLQHASNLYGSTPPICIAVPSWLPSLEDRETQQYTHLPFARQHASHLHGSTFQKVVGVGVTGEFLKQACLRLGPEFSHRLCPCNLGKYSMLREHATDWVIASQKLSLRKLESRHRIWPGEGSAVQRKWSHVAPESLNSFASRPIEISKNTWTQGLRARYDPVLPPSMSIVRSPSRPVISAPEKRLWRFRSLFGGSEEKVQKKVLGKKIAGHFPRSRNAANSWISGTGKTNPPGTFGRHCWDLVPTFRAGCFLKSTVPAFPSFSESREEGTAIQMGGVLPYKLEVYYCTFSVTSRGWSFWSSSDLPSPKLSPKMPPKLPRPQERAFFLSNFPTR